LVSLIAHIGFGTQHRELLITKTVRARLIESMGGTLRAHDCVLLAAGGMPDRVHLVASPGTQGSACWHGRVF
jgi:REP element-mobilizing transposase RayT